MISSKTFYAIAAMVHVSEKSGESPVNLLEISQKLNISTSYLEQIFIQLRNHGLVEGVRGPGGGYRISKPSFRISIADIVDAFEVYPKKPKLSKRPSSGSKDAVLSSMLWDEVSSRLYQFLSTITLAKYTHKFNRSSLIPDNCTTYKIATMFPARQPAVVEARAE